MNHSLNNFKGKEEQLKQAFGKILEKLVQDKKNGKLCYGYGNFEEGKICAYSLIQQAKDHLFDDKYTLFGISSNDGAIVRDYSQLVPLEQVIKDLHTEFPGILDEEPEFILKNFNTAKE